MAKLQKEYELSIPRRKVFGSFVWKLIIGSVLIVTTIIIHLFTKVKVRILAFVMVAGIFLFITAIKSFSIYRKSKNINSDKISIHQKSINLPLGTFSGQHDHFQYDQIDSVYYQKSLLKGNKVIINTNTGIYYYEEMLFKDKSEIKDLIDEIDKKILKFSKS